MRLLAIILAVPMSLAPCLASAAPQEPAGVVKYMAGDVNIVRDDQTIQAAPNSMVFEGDVIRTGFTGKVGLILVDDTVISMGRRSKLVLTKCLFRPRDDKLSLIVSLLRGTAAFISGQIAKLAPNAMQIETPHAAIGVRGSQVLVEVD